MYKKYQTSAQDGAEWSAFLVMCFGPTKETPNTTRCGGDDDDDDISELG
jgi:hypothetical protein